MQNESAPIEIRQLLASRELEIIWSDGSIARIKDVDLRRACRCTDCRRESGGPSMISHSENIRILKIIPVGAYAVQFCFDDQHDRGIFPWDYLRQLGRTV